MSKIRWYGPTLILLAAALAVMVFGPQAAKQIAWAQADARMTATKKELTENTSLANLSDAFRKVAEVVDPSVVHVETFSKDGPWNRRQDMGPFPFPFPFQRDPRMMPRRRNDAMEEYDVPRRVGNGSGWVYDADHVVTNYHVVNGADRLLLRFNDGSERDAKIVGVDDKTDIAVLKVEGGHMHPATIATEIVEKGDIVFAFGSPLHFEFTMSQGIVSAKNRRLRIVAEGRGYENFIQTDAAINPGNSGGPLVNIYGQVVGMNTAIATNSMAASYSGLGFAIPVKMVQNIVEQLLEKGEVSRGYMGIAIQELTPELARTYNYEGTGVLITSAFPGTPAEKAGLQSEDIITKLNGKAVASVDDLRAIVANEAPGTKIKLEVLRDGKTLEVEMELAKQPTDDTLLGSAAPIERPGASEHQGVTRLRQLGIDDAQTLTPQLCQQLGLPEVSGVIIVSVRPGSAAAAAQLGRGMILVEVMGKSTVDVEALANVLKESDLVKGIRVKVLIRTDDGQLVPRVIFLALPHE